MQTKKLLRNVFALSALCGIFLANCAYAEVAQVIGPRISVNEPTYEFGAVSQGSIVEHEFTVENNGKETLDIQRVQSDCGCTTSISDPRKIAPGETGIIKVSFDTAGFVGDKVKSVRVFSNDPQRPSLVLSLNGSVITEVEVEPARLLFGVVRKGSQESRTAEISSTPGSKVEILGISSRSDRIQIKEEEGSDKTSKKITVSLKPNVPVGILRSRIVVRTSSKKTPVVNVPIFARVEGDIRFDPPEVSFGLVPGPVSADLSQTVRLINENTSGTKVHILKVEPSTPNLNVKVVPIKDGEEYQLKVEVAEGSLGSITSQVQVTTDHPDPEQQQLILPVYGIIANKGA